VGSKTFQCPIDDAILNFGFRWRRLLHGAFIFIETAAFRKLGGFSAETFAGEDWELKPAIDRTFKGNGETFCHSAPASHRDLGAEDKDLFVITPFRVLYHIVFVPRRIKVSREKGRRWYDGRR